MIADVKVTKEYYRSLDSSLLCDCDYCKSYRSQIKTEYPEVATYLDTLGVDIEKPFETSPLEPDENGVLEYCCCQYIVFGSCEMDYHHQIDDIEIRVSTSYPSTGIDREHFVLEFYPIRLRLNYGMYGWTMS